MVAAFVKKALIGKVADARHHPRKGITRHNLLKLNPIREVTVTKKGVIQQLFLLPRKM